MPTRKYRSLSLAVLLLAGVLIGLPWATAGLSPFGQVSCVLLLILAAVAGLFPHGHGPRLRPSLLLLSAGILAGISAIHTIYPDRTVQSLLLFLAYLLAGTLATHGVREVPWARRVLLGSLVASGVLICGVGMLRLIQGKDGGIYANLLTGPFGYPNAMAGFLLLSGGAALAMAREDPRLVVRAVAMTAGVMAGVGILLTRSRGAMVAGTVALVLWAVAERRSWWPRRRPWLWIWMGIGLAAIPVWFSRSPGRLLPVFWRLANPLEDSSLQWRWQILRWTWDMARDHPWWGVGPGGFPVALIHYQRLPYVSGMNPHNLYLELAAEYGFPAAILALLAIGAFLARGSSALRNASAEDPVRRGLAALVATLIAFLVHSLVDLDWSFPAVALAAATLFGLALAHLPGKGPQGLRAVPIWRGVLLLLLAAAAALAVTRYSAGTLVTWARLALATGETATAQRHLTWALRLNPLSFSAHYWMAWARIQSGDTAGALEVAERAARIAPLDPYGHSLVGEIAAAAGRWDVAEDRFRAAVHRAPSTQLRFYAGLIEAATSGGRPAEARSWYEKATAIFSPERVLDTEARCLAPGDRYLLARMSRIAARLYAEVGDPARQEAATDRARLLAQPDHRGICVTRGRPGQTSPEAVMESFWPALAEGGWPRAEQLLTPRLRSSRREDVTSGWETGGQPHRARLTWIAALSGGERQANLRFEVEVEIAPGRRVARCAQADLRLIGDDWFLETLPVLAQEPCWV
jgi:O-antigen ligase